MSRIAPALLCVAAATACKREHVEPTPAASSEVAPLPPPKEPPNATLDGAPLVLTRVAVHGTSSGKLMALGLSTEASGCEEPWADKKPALRVGLTLAPVLRGGGASSWIISDVTVSGADLAVHQYARKHEDLPITLAGDVESGITLTLGRELKLEALPSSVDAPRREVVLRGAWRAKGCGRRPLLTPGDAAAPPAAVPQPALKLSVGDVPQTIASALWAPKKNGHHELLLSTLPRTCSVLESGADVYYDLEVDGARAVRATLGGALVTWHPHAFTADAPVVKVGTTKGTTVAIDVHGSYVHPEANNDKALPVKLDGRVLATVCPTFDF